MMHIGHFYSLVMSWIPLELFKVGLMNLPISKSANKYNRADSCKNASVCDESMIFVSCWHKNVD